MSAGVPDHAPAAARSVPCLRRESLKDGAGGGACLAAALGSPSLSVAPARAEEPRDV